MTRRFSYDSKYSKDYLESQLEAEQRNVAYMCKKKMQIDQSCSSDLSPSKILGNNLNGQCDLSPLKIRENNLNGQNNEPLSLNQACLASQDETIPPYVSNQIANDGIPLQQQIVANGPRLATDDIPLQQVANSQCYDQTPYAAPDLCNYAYGSYSPLPPMYYNSIIAPNYQQISNSYQPIATETISDGNRFQSTSSSCNAYQRGTSINAYQPSTALNAYQPNTSLSAYQPSGIGNSYQTNGIGDAYQPNGTGNIYQLNATGNSYQPSTALNAYQPNGTGNGFYCPQYGLIYPACDNSGQFFVLYPPKV